MERDINETGLLLVKAFEGLRVEAYQDSAGVWTIGYGHSSKAGEPRVTPGLRITEAEAETILRRDLDRFEAEVARLVTVPLTDNEFAALTSLCFNIGAAAFAGSTCLKRLNSGDRKGAAEALTWWNKATVRGKKVRMGGLVRRRAAEKALFLTLPERTAIALQQAAELAEEPQETRSHWTGSRTVVGAATAAAGALGAAGEVIDQVKDAADSASGFFGKAGELAAAHPLLLGCFALALAGIAVVVFARRDDWLKGAR